MNSMTTPRHTPRQPHHADPALHALDAASGAVLTQCLALVDHVDDRAFGAPSHRLAGGTLGKHLRHVLDHYSALLNAIEDPSGPPVTYDRRERHVAMECDRAAARAAIHALRGRLQEVLRAGVDAPVRVLVLPSPDATEIELRSTFGRELAFATHHAIHHQAMMRSIAAEFGVSLDDSFGKAPSTLRHEGAAHAH